MKASALRWAAGLALTMLLLAGSAVGAAAWWLHQRYQQGLQSLEPRLQRWAGLVQAGPEVEEALARVEGWLQPWPHDGGAAAAGEVSQRLRQSIDTAGLTTVALQAAEPQAWVPGLLRVRFTVTVTGPWPAAVQWLHRLQQQSPVFWIQSAQMMREGRDAVGEPQTVRVTLQLDAPLRQEGATP